MYVSAFATNMIRLPRFYPILDTGLLAQRGLDVVLTAGSLLSAGAPILQFRHKGLWTREIVHQAEQIAALCHSRVPFVINDRADMALLLGAWLHVGQDDLTPAMCRRVVKPDTVMGFSTHNRMQLLEASAEPVDYLAIGPIFGTASKENPDPVVGLPELAAMRPLTQRPLVAIGGITRANAESVWNAGADSVAVIGDLYPADGGLDQVVARTRDWMTLATAGAN